MIRKILAAVDVNPGDFNLPNSDPNGVVSENAIKTILEMVFTISGAVAVLIITIAGLFYVISLGNPQATKKAKDTILYALIGLGVSIFAYTIVRFVIGQL